MSSASKASRIRAALLGTVAVVAVGAGVLTFQPPRSPFVASATAQGVQTAPMSFADVVEKVKPAVVSVRVSQPAPTQAMSFRDLPGGDDENGQMERFMRRFGEQFRNDPRFGGPGGQGGPRFGGPRGHGGPRSMSQGSGFFISADGYIVTNNHVVENAESIKVVLKDERELDAEVVGRDEATDLAVLRVKGGRGPFPFVNFENAGKPRVGDWVITVGNPFGLGGTATAGIISAYGRDIGETFVDYIQIDAPINRGNSGGPTFDVYGRVIGVNTAIFSPSGGSVGIGFAIPSEVAESVTKQLMSGGKIERGYIGATIQNFSGESAEAMGLGDQKGAIVADIAPGGPSSRAGLQVGDVVIAVNGTAVKSSSDLTRQVARVRAGDVLRLDVIRGAAKRVVEVRSGTRPSERELASNDNSPGGRQGAAPGAPGAAASAPVLGMSLGALDEGARNRLNLPAEVRGALVQSVDQASDAGAKGLRRGDVLTLANGRAVGTPQEFAAVVADAKKAGRTSVLVGVFRNGRTAFLPIKVSG